MFESFVAAERRRVPAGPIDDSIGRLAALGRKGAALPDIDPEDAGLDRLV
jgi:hypothetical protein